MVQVGLSLMLDDAFREAALPLFEAGHVDVLEYSFELGWARGRPPWAEALLQYYGSQGRLWGHGVTYAPCVAAPSDAQVAWLERVVQDVSVLQLRGVSEHVGFMGGEGADVGAPLPPPPGDASRVVTARAMQALAERVGTPVGLENLGLAFCAADAEAGAELLHAVLEDVDGFLVLDLHNLFCLSQNLGIDGATLLESLPLERAAVAHVSGGSWREHAGTRWRRDTHDGPVPDAVLDLLRKALPRCPKLEAVVLERLGPTLGEGRGAELATDLAKVRSICGVGS